jgi:hypothetical protein
VLIANLLKKKGVVLICGSLKVQLTVKEVLDNIASQKLNIGVKKLKENKNRLLLKLYICVRN